MGYVRILNCNVVLEDRHLEALGSTVDQRNMRAQAVGAVTGILF